MTQAEMETLRRWLDHRLSQLKDRRAASQTGDASWSSFDLGMLCGLQDVATVLEGFER